MHDYNLAEGLASHTRFDNLDLISRSQVCQNHKLQIVARFFSTVVRLCMVTTHIKMIKHSMPCVTGVYLRDVINMIFVILHLNVCRLSICSPC